MDKHLFFICPTDHLEVIINNTFKQENYFYSSLANSLMLDIDMVGHLNDLIETTYISEITFVLSDDNKIIREALINKDYADLRGLNKFYNHISYQKKRFGLIVQKQDLTRSLLSYYLNIRIKELNQKLSASWFSGQIKINAQIYERKQSNFLQINSKTFYKECFNLN